MKTALKCAPTSTLDSNHILVEAINELCEATYVAEFLRGLFTRDDGQQIKQLSVPEIYGLANVVGDLITRIEKASGELMKLEGACNEE